MRWRAVKAEWSAVLIAIGVLVLVGLPVASAGVAPPPQFPSGFGLNDFCSDEDHSGAPYDDPNGGPAFDSLSVIPFGGSLTDMPIDSFVGSFELTAMSPGGTELGYEGPILDDALFQGAIGINEGGDYPITDFTVTLEGDFGTVSESIDPATFPNGGVMSVTFDASQPCDATTVEPGTTVLVEATPETSETSETSASTETSETTSTTATVEDEDDTETTEDGDDDFPWEVLLFSGLGIAGVGIVLWLLARPGRPCIEELRAWQAAQDACDKARERQRRAEQDLEKARTAREEAEEDLEDHCDQYPPACRAESWIEDATTGERVTSADLWVNRQWAEQAWDQYADAPSQERAQQTEQAWKDGPPDDWAGKKRDELDQARKRHDQLEKATKEAREAEETAQKATDRAREAADEACRDAVKKREAYEECVGAETEKAAKEPPPTDEPTGPTGPGGPGTVAKPEPGSPCEQEDERVEILATFGPRDVAADFSIIAVPDGLHGYQDGGQLSVQLGQLASELDAGFDLLGGAGAGKAAAAGEYRDAALQAQGTVTDIPSSLPDAIGEILEFTAELGSTVAGAADRWMEGHESFNVRSPVFVWRIEARWLEIWRCENGEWTCSRELEFSRGRLRKTQYHRPADVPAPHLADELRRRTVGLQSKVRNDLQAMKDFLELHTPGPCS